PTMKLPYKILVLDDDEHALAGIVELLRDLAYLVTGATTYDAAKRLLALGSYDLLVTDVRLRGFNGINLVRQSHADYPDMAVMIITGYDEPMLGLEVSRYGACFAAKPIKPVEFLASVKACLADVRRQRRWTRKRVAGGFSVTAHSRPAVIVDICYGGLQLEVSHTEPLPATFDIEVSGIRLRFEVDTVWARTSDDGQGILCGAALATDATPAARTWRAIVDRLA
ncbi:MAG TPA: response regulator, partial [Vicinamibacterales bacterium]|nr:response regulator [Vicinamibacterales bacterium]